MLPALVLTGTAAAPAPAATYAGACAGLARCHVVAHVDVTGDGRADTVAVARRGRDGAPQGRVIVRVRDAGGRSVTTSRRTEAWYGAPWQGAARLDGRPGAELVLGRLTGAHAAFFQVLTWRAGRLRALDAPGPDRWWGIDAAVWVDLGWLRRPHDPVGTVRRRYAVRQGTAVEGPFRGTVTTYRWTRDGWQRTARRVVEPMTDRQAARWAGWRVPGLTRW